MKKYKMIALLIQGLTVVMSSEPYSVSVSSAPNDWMFRFPFAAKGEDVKLDEFKAMTPFEQELILTLQKISRSLELLVREVEE